MKDANEAESAQPYFIPRHVYFCEIGSQVVFLDLRRDKYLAIGRAERRALSGLVAGWPATDAASAESESAGDSAPIVKSMLARGLLTPHQAAGKQAAPTTAELVHELLIDDDFHRRAATSTALISAFLLACGRAKMALSLRSLERVVESVRRRKVRATARGCEFDLPKSRELVAIFNRLRPFVFTSKDACLFDSLALLEFLALQRLYPNWLFGVQTQPFGAHSWVQHQQFVFNGNVEFVRRFTPILAV